MGFPTYPKYDASDTVLLYPSDDAKFLDEIEDLSAVKRCVVIESKWMNARQILKRDDIRSLPKVRIRNRESMYWRYQENTRYALATIEAIYWFVREYAEAQNGKYDGEVDDLLLF